MTGPSHPLNKRGLADRRRARRWAVLLLAAVITLVNQGWVGENTIYGDDLRERRQQAHASLVANEPMGDTWTEQGHNRTNIRVVALLIGEGANRLLAIPVGTAYRTLDTLALFALLLLLYPYLRRHASPTVSVAGLAFVGAILPLTYLFHYFHPWDRLSALAWLLLLMAVRDDRYAALLLLLPVAVAVKFDAVVVAGLYWLVHVRRDDWRRATGRAAILGLLGFGAYLGLRLARPGGFEAPDMIGQVLDNIRVALSLNVRYPPLLVFALPVYLAALGWRRGDRFERAGAAFGLALLLPLFLATNFVEVRAHVPVLLLLLPAAALGLESLLAVPDHTRGGAEPADVLRAEHPPAATRARRRAVAGGGPIITSSPARDRRRP